MVGFGLWIRCQRLWHGDCCQSRPQFKPLDTKGRLGSGIDKNRTIDWQKKETARAQMRKMVKRLLKKYKYPPEDYDFAISTVISQCELWTDNVEPRKEEKLYKYVSEIELSKVAEDTVSYGEKK